MGRSQTATKSGLTPPRLDRPGSSHRNWPAIVLIGWWAIFAGVSLYWACGGNWLVDTAVEAEGVELAKERPAWLFFVLLLTVILKGALALFGYLVGFQRWRWVPRWCYLLFGFGAGLLMVGYGLMFSVRLVPLAFSGTMNAYRWMRLLVWMPQFWVGGLLMVAATFVYARRTRNTRRGQEISSR